MTSIQPVPTDCPFCQRISKAEYEGVYYMGRTVFFEPLNPVVPGHRLFVPREHVTDAADDPKITAEVFGAAAAYAEHKRFFHTDFNLITSAGGAATQSVFHLHVHYIPRRKGDGLLLPWTNQEAPGSVEEEDS